MAGGWRLAAGDELPPPVPRPRLLPPPVPIPGFI